MIWYVQLSSRFHQALFPPRYYLPRWLAYSKVLSHFGKIVQISWQSFQLLCRISTDIACYSPVLPKYKADSNTAGKIRFGRTTVQLILVDAELMKLGNFPIEAIRTHSSVSRIKMGGNKVYRIDQEACTSLYSFIVMHLQVCMCISIHSMESKHPVFIFHIYKFQ